MSAIEVGAIVLVVTVAASVQGAIGFGMALIASPLLVLVDPQLVPAPLMMSSLVLVTLMAIRDHAHADFITVRWAILGNVVGAAAGASVLTVLSPAGFGLLFGAVVLLGVGLSVLGVHVRVRRRSAAGAGLLGGFMATTSAIGGPPIALVYQHADSDSFRGTLATYLIVSCVVGLVALFLAGRFRMPEVELGLLLIPGQVTGFLLSNWLAKLLHGRSIRPFILGLSGFAGVAVLVRVALMSA
jgi:uncharacterized membrane protein YfcA